jgi:hypothetical protein
LNESIIIYNHNYLIDYKTTSWGWDSRKKTDKMLIYQLVFYKYFLTNKLKLDINDINIHFILLKRTAKKDKVEFVDVTSGEKRIKNAKGEVEYFQDYDYLIINDNLEIAAKQLVCIANITRIKSTLFPKDKVVSSWLN